MNRLLIMTLLLPFLGYAKEQASLGQGYSSQGRKLESLCLDGSVESFPNSYQTVSMSLESDFNDSFQKEWGELSLGLNLHILGLKGSLAYLSQITESDTSLSVELSFQNQAVILRYIPRAIDYHEGCGDSFIQELNLGSQLSLAIVLDFRSKQELERFKRTFSVSFLFGLFKKTYSSIETIQDQKFDLSLKVVGYQRGGSPDRLNRILALQDTCNLAQGLERCHTVIRKALDYVNNSGGFLEQISTAIESQDFEQLAIVGMRTKSYAESGFPEIPDRVSIERPTLSPKIASIIEHLRKIHLKIAQRGEDQSLQKALMETELLLDTCSLNELSAGCLKTSLPEI